MNFQIHQPPTPNQYILFNLVDIQVILEHLLAIFSVMQFQKTISGNITATFSDYLPKFVISANTFVDPPSNKSNGFEKDWSNSDQENFVLDYFDIDWSNILKLDDKNVNKRFPRYYEFCIE